MSLSYPITVFAVVFCLLLGSGMPASAALYHAARPQNWGKVLGRLPLSDHAITGHPGQNVNAVLIQLWLSHDACYPRKFYVGCNRGTRVLFACKVTPASSIWAVLSLGVPYGKGIEDSRIITGYGVAENRLDKTALSHGCYVPAIDMPLP